MFDLSSKYKYTLKQDKVIQYRSEFFKFTCNRNGDDTQINKDELFLFLKRQGFQIGFDLLAYINREIFKKNDKAKYNAAETVAILGRLSIPEEIVEEMKIVFDYFDCTKRKKLTALDLKRGIEKTGTEMENKKIEEIFSELDVDEDGLINFEDFLCAILTR